jgi:hypothetical protein
VPRYSQDFDTFIRATRENAERVVVFQSLGDLVGDREAFVHRETSLALPRCHRVSVHHRISAP